MAQPAIRFDHVSKRFRRGERFDSLRDFVPGMARRFSGRAENDPREFWALNDVCFEVQPGETVGIIGHNGAGKSTMLKHLAGIMRPTNGRIDVHGRLAALIEIGAGFHDDLTGRENVFLNGVILGMSRAEVARKFDEIVDFAGLAAFIDTPVKHYSSGMYARLGFAVAAHLDPEILVIDEVLSVGDFVFQQKSLQKMRSVARSGATVLFVSHNLKAVSDLCARSLLLDAGSVARDGATSAVIETYLRHERTRLERRSVGPVAIRSVELRSRAGSALHFRPGDKAWVDVRFAATQPCQRVAVVLSFLGEGLDEIFNTSSERLGLPPMDLAAGEARSVSFELDMHLAPGTFHVAVYLYRYDLQKEYDRLLPATTFFVESDTDVRGYANLYPRVTSAPA